MSEILVEVVGPASGDLGVRTTGPERFADRADEIVDSVTAIAAQVRDRLEREPELEDAHTWGLDQLELSFQLAVQVQGGVVIKASGAATFGVKLTWKPSSAGD
jgi:Trypsin-co-occurring domain 1